MNTILIKNARLQDEMVDVLIQGNRFVAIGPGIDAQVQEVIDATGLAIFPSLHNCHTHAAMTLMRGYADDLRLQTWLSEHIWPLEAKLTEEDIYWGAKLACLEMIKSGTTFFTDMYWHWQSTARAVQEMGLRAALSAAFFDFNDLARAAEMKEQVQNLREQSRSYGERIQFILGPHAIYTVSTDSLNWLQSYAQDEGLRVHLHLSETEQEVADCQAAHGMRPVEYLHSLDLLGPHLSLAHGVWLSEAEMALLAEHEVQVVHCPVSNMKLASGHFDYAALRRHGVQVALGTDGCASNNNLDMLEEMKIASLLAKVNGQDPTLLSAAETLDLGTINGARAFGLESGRIASGCLADCILIQTKNVCLTPGFHLVSDLIYSAGSSCIDTTICNGRVLMRGGTVEGEEEILARARDCAMRLTGQEPGSDRCS